MSYDPIFPTTKGILRKLGGDKIERKKKTISFDGDFTGKETVAYKNGFVKISDEVIDITAAKRVVLTVNGANYECTDITANSPYFGFGLMAYSDILVANTLVALCVHTAQATGFTATGIYVLGNEDINAYISTIELITETIHPIDPKYLPGVYEKTMLYDGAPVKMDLSDAGLGYAYLLSNEDLFSRAYGQNVHYEYTLASGTKAHGVLSNYDYMDELSMPLVYGAFSLLYAPTLGGTGISFNYADIGEISNLKLWTEYSENKPYYVTGYYNVGTNAQFIPVELEKAKVAACAMRLMVRYLDIGGNTIHYIPTKTFGTSDTLYITVTEGDLDVQNGIISAGW